MRDLICLENLKEEAEQHFNDLESRKRETFEVIDTLFKNTKALEERKKEYLEIILDIKKTISEIKEELKKYYN